MKLIYQLLFLSNLLFACTSTDDTTTDTQITTVSPIPKEEEKKENNTTNNKDVIVERVTISENENNYLFSVTLTSPDTGCEQYANWWEVIDKDGELISRRILGHSHVNEQPFTRSSTVKVSKEQELIIRAHMNTTGYGSEILKGSVLNGFKKETISKEFAKELASKAPLPNGCAF